ncbi:MAG TPA: hypothetical protein VIS94_17850 [Desulfomonilia bacterium]
MKPLIRIFIIILITAACLEASVKVGPWKKIRESDGITGWVRTNSRSSVDEVRAEGIIDAPMSVVEAILRDIPAQKKFMFLCEDARRIELPGYPDTPDSFSTYFQQGLPWPLSDRYGLGRISFMLEKETGRIIVRGLAVKADFKPEKPGMVEMPFGDVTWTLKEEGGKKTLLTYQLLTDPGGNLPSSIVNMLLKNLGVTTLKNIRKLSKMPPYKDARTVLTTTPYLQD